MWQLAPIIAQGQWIRDAAARYFVQRRRGRIDADGSVQPAPDDPLLAGKTTYWESIGHITRTVAIG